MSPPLDPLSALRLRARRACALPLLFACVLAACGEAGALSVPVPRPAAGRELEPALAHGVEDAARAVERAQAAGEREAAAAAMLELAYRYDAGAVHDLARAAYRGVLTLDPASSNAAVNLARMEQELGAPEAALTLLAGVEAEGAFGAAVAWRAGLLHLALDRLDAADASFARAIELAPDDVSGWIGRARVALQRADYGRAESLLQEALLCNPGDGYVCELLARAARARGDESAVRSALAQSGQATAAWRDPWMVDVVGFAVGFGNALRRTEAYLAAGRAQEALLALEELARERPEHSTLASMRASALLDLGRTQAALAVVDAALAIHPEHFRLHLNRALVLQRTGDSRSALASAQRAVAILPGYASGHALVAELLADVGAHGPARAALARARSLGAPARVLSVVEARIARSEAEGGG